MTKITPRGKTPSLIGGTNGRPKRVTAARKSICYRCKDELVAGQACIDIPKIGGAYSTSRRVCDTCYNGIIEKTAEDLAELKSV